MPYEIRFGRFAERRFSKQNRQFREQIGLAISELATDPRPPGVKKLKGSDGLYRIRVGDYRIIYEIQDRLLVVLIVTVGHRRDIYKDLS
jgi:mRNA interferase RelE/StbE